VGGRVAVIDATRTRMGTLRAGIQTSNWLAHDADGPTVTHPAALAGELRARFGEDPLAMGSDRFLRRNPDMASFVRILRDRASWKATWCREQLQSTHWDLFYVTFGEAHDIGHLGWHIHDETHPEHDPAQRASLGDPLLEIYRHLDSCVEDLVSAAGPDASVVIVTGPGMERNACGNHLLALILQRLQQATAAGVPRRIKTALGSIRDRITGSDPERERANSLYFTVPCNDNAGAIRINLAGREPKGRVARGEDYERTVTRLCDALAEIHDSAGRPAVSDFVRNPIQENAGRATALPDLLAIWNRECDFRCVSSPKIGRLESNMRRERTGDHTDRGEMIVPKSWVDLDASSGSLDPANAGRLVEICAAAALTPTRLGR
jgi:predicted AlkP superfamily phosphohydrolase/phosphomutase